MIYGKKILFSLIAILGVSSSQVNADVIVDDAELKYIALFDSDMLITTNITGGLSVLVNEIGGGDFEFSTGVVGSSYRLFSSGHGLELTSVQATDWLVLVPGTSLQAFSLGETRYYSYWEDILGSDRDIPDATDNYGWVSLTYTGTELVVSDSATALGGGIIVGTYTQVPEPATVLLFGLGGFGAWLLRRNGKSQNAMG